MHGLKLLAALVALAGCPADPTEPSQDSEDTEGATGTGTDTNGTPPDTDDPPPDDTSGTTEGPPPGTTTEDTTTGDPPGSESSGNPLEGDVLQNDSWTPADSLVWQSWPGVGDCWASTFQADMAQYPFDLVGAVAAIGNGDASTYTFEVGVWEVDNQGMPTAEVDSRTFSVVGDTVQLTEVDLSGLTVPTFMMNDEFALVMCHTEHMGPPSIAVDDDGDVDGGRNWVYSVANGEWVSAPDFFGISGDFILRAVIMPI